MHKITNLYKIETIFDNHVSTGGEYNLLPSKKFSDYDLFEITICPYIFVPKTPFGASVISYETFKNHGVEILTRWSDLHGVHGFGVELISDTKIKITYFGEQDAFGYIKGIKF